MDFIITKFDSGAARGAMRAVIEASIMRKDSQCAAGSKIMEGFISPFDATVVSRLEEANIEIVGIAKMDEFGITGLFADKLEHCSGAVSAVEKGIADIALCNDFTGYVGQQAAERGLYYIHPTYGTVSRFGLIPAASSMDQIGIVCKQPDRGFKVLAQIAGSDPKDGAMYESMLKSVDVDTSNKDGDVSQSLFNGKPLRMAIPGNINAIYKHEADLASLFPNAETINFELAYFDAYKQIMQILCSAEISSNISRYDGISFGYRAQGFANLQELYTKSRTEALGKYAKLAAILGAMVLSKENYLRYYDKAMRIRRIVKESLDFSKYDSIVLPATVNGMHMGTKHGSNTDIVNAESTITSKTQEAEASSATTDTLSAWNLGLYALPRLCGLPAMTIPTNTGGITLVADAGREDILLALSRFAVE